MTVQSTETSRGRLAVTPPSRYADVWSAFARTRDQATPREALNLEAGDSVVVVGAHPDDETLGLGAGIAQLVADGVEVHLVCASAGEAALDHVGVVVPDLAERRLAELRRAADGLGVTGVNMLDLPDGRLSAHEGDIAEALADVVRSTAAGHLLTIWWEDPHPDHAATGRAALRAGTETGVGVSGYPVWAPHWTDLRHVPATDTAMVALTASAEARRRKTVALAGYSTQTEPLSSAVEAVLPREVVEWPFEMLVRR